MPERDAGPDAVRNALAACIGGGRFKDHAAVLLGALGYRSELTEDLGSVEEFVNWLDDDPDHPLTDKQRQVFNPWRTADIVFQFTDANIAGQSGLFAEPFDRGRAKSFLFVAADLEPRPGNRPYSRTDLGTMTRVVNSRLAMPVIPLFRHGETLTLAAVQRRAHKRDDSRDVLERVTLIKDIRAADPHRAHLDILCELALEDHIRAGVRTFGDLHKAWERVLDIEKLNRRFYRELFAWFERAAGECGFPDDGTGDGSTERHVIRLITRLLFIWFLKEKGLVSERLFDERFARAALVNHNPERSDYYQAVLQNLFFATLNTPIDKRAFSSRSQKTHRDFSLYRYRDLLADPDNFIESLEAIPFVNGGLFDCLDDFEGQTAGGRRVDVFTDNETQRGDLDVPARLLFDNAGLFPLFRKFKFTVEENTPIDQEVALDPELLGRVFEHLLAAYNPETRETARKTTGSYYTPRKVVDYMVHEALTEALANAANSAEGDGKWWRERIDYLLDHSSTRADAGDFFETDEKQSLVTAIAKLKVLDPAVGSGAFPMAILQTLTLALRRLDPDNSLWETLQKQRATERAGRAFDTCDQRERDTELAEISDTFEKYRTTDFGRKLYLIQNSVFGVDIQPIACQIAKLRFFISLVIEQMADPTADNLGIRPLPNLETRFVSADTLLGLEQAGQVALTSDSITQLHQALRTNRERHFHAGDRDMKRALREEDKRIRDRLSDELKHCGFDADAAHAIAGWDPYDQNAHSDWFDAQYMFGVSRGFDVVIGNPPYVRADSGARHLDMRRRIKDSGQYETLYEKWDLYIPFVERGYKLLSPGGFATMIVSDAYCHSKYAQQSQEWFLKHSRILRLDFFSKIQIFDAAVRNVTYLFQKVDGRHNRPRRRVHDPEFGIVRELPSDEQCKLTHRVFFPEDSGARRFAAATVRLAEICYITVGMVVHADEKTAQGAFELQDLVQEHKDARHPKPFVEGKHLARWLPATRNWLEWGTARAPALFRRTTFPELYAVEEKLLSVDIAASADKLRVAYDDQKLHHNHSAWSFVPWHQLAGIRNRSIKKQTRYRDERPRRADLPARESLEETSRRFDMKFLLGVMNSTMARDFLRANRRSNLHLYPDDWKKLPIPDVTSKEQVPVAALVDQILAAKRTDPQAEIAALEDEIDQLVYALYDLTEEEALQSPGSNALARRP
ncbi:MAG: Eco57I restriction-modification methylase domain-containing protein [Acidobacteria bacterium]|nr:Eco57I restriction-modification methylase domain-containing protein [Acidobacteriota bacterium]